MRRLTGKATEMMVASKAVARLTTAIEIKAARSRQPGLNFSTSSEFDFSISAGFDLADGSTISSIPSGPIRSGLLISEPAGASIPVPGAAHCAEAGFKEY